MVFMALRVHVSVNLRNPRVETSSENEVCAALQLNNDIFRPFACAADFTEQEGHLCTSSSL